MASIDIFFGGLVLGTERARLKAEHSGQSRQYGTGACWFGTLRESSHGSLSLARAAAMASRTTGIKNFILALFPSLSLLSTELSYAKAHSLNCCPGTPIN
jgi:hypothetical protein